MKSIELYVKGIVFSFETLLKGKFLIYFLPGFIVSLALWFIYYQLSLFEENVDATADVWLVGGAVSWVFSMLGDMITFFVEQLYIFILLVCFSPFNCALSEKYDNYITGNKFSGGIVRMINDLLRALFIVILSILLEYAFIILYWFLTFLIPNSIEVYLSPIVYFIIPAFFIGLAFFDYSLERYGEGTISSMGYSFSRVLTMVIAGSLFLLIYKIPFVGIILAPVILTMLTTYVYVHREGKLQQVNEGNEELLDQTV